MKFCILFSIGTCLLIGCDPLRRIDMKNSSGEDVEIIWTLKDLDSLYKSPFFLSNSKTVRFSLKKDQPYNHVNMSFGIGTWSREYLKSVTDRLDTLEIRSANKIIKLDSEEMNTFLSERKRGIGKRKINIHINKS